MITFIVGCIFDFIRRYVFYSHGLGIIAAIAMACMFIVYAINEGKPKKHEDEELPASNSEE